MSRRIKLPPPGRVFAPTVDKTMVDDFTLRAARLRSKQQPPGVPPMYPLPLRNHPMWSGNNELGMEVAFAPDANNRQTILKMDEWGFPEIWTVMLGIKYTDSLFPGPGFEVVAVVNAGSGGATQTIEIDWVQGAVFSLPMNALNLVAQYQNADGVPSDLRLLVTLGRKPHGNHKPTRSIRQFDIAAAATSPNVRVPAFARNVQVLPLNSVTAASIYDAAANSRLVIDEDPNGVGTPAAVLRGDQLLAFGADGVPIPRKGKYVHWINGSAVEHDIVYVFTIDL